jgi:photosystem II stability/assembly factor-like uncharacterized protein
MGDGGASVARNAVRAGAGGSSVVEVTGGGGMHAGGSGGSPVASGGAGGSPNVEMTGGGGKGGSNNSGGSGGGGGGPPHVVGKCDGLGAVDQWEEISPSAFHTPNNMETTCVGVNPLDQSVYAAAGNKTNGGNAGTGVYRSSDCGATWTKISVTPNLETGDCFGFLVDPVEPKNMYYDNGYGNNPTVYKSSDGGVNWTPLATDASHVLQYNFVDKLAMDPTAHEHVVVTYHENCKDPLGPQCLSETTDGGATWRQLKGPDKGFAEGNRIAMMGSKNWVYTSNNGGWFTGDGGATWTRVIDGAPADMFVGDGVAYMAVYSSGIYMSNAAAMLLGATWTLIKNSPAGANVATDGMRIFTSVDQTAQPFQFASAMNPTAWTHMQSPNIGRRTNQFAYDADHHILYSASIGAGLFRVVTR